MVFVLCPLLLRPSDQNIKKKQRYFSSSSPSTPPHQTRTRTPEIPRTATPVLCARLEVPESWRIFLHATAAEQELATRSCASIRLRLGGGFNGEGKEETSLVVFSRSLWKLKEKLQVKAVKLRNENKTYFTSKYFGLFQAANTLRESCGHVAFALFPSGALLQKCRLL